MAETAKAVPQDRKAPAKKKNDTTAQQKKVLAEFMASGIDFTQFTIDPGDGIEWGFKPDPLPTETTAIQKAMEALEASTKEEGGDVNAAFDVLVEAIRAVIIDPKQAEEFPKPLYGTNAILFFAMHLIAGRSGFPTE